MPKEYSFHYGFLDTLRTLAIVLVLLRHSIRPFLPDLSDTTVDDAIWTPIKNLMANGWVGVDLFFLLSGFLIAQPFLRSPDVSIKKFYQNRMIRIFPVYFLVLTLVVIGFFPYYTPPSENLFQSIILHGFFLHDYTGSDINVVFWSLGVELKFYLIAPFILIFTGRYIHSNQWTKAYLLIIPFIFLAPFLRFITYINHSDIEGYNNFFAIIRSPFHMNMDGLFFGVLLAVIFKQIRPNLENKKLTGFMFVILSCVTTLYLTSHNLLETFGLFDAVFQTFIISLLFLGLALSGLFFFSNQGADIVSLWGARLSYSIYLIHWPLMPFCLILANLFRTETAYDSLTSALIFMFTLWTTSIAIAYVFYLLIEKPFSKLKNKL